MTTLREFLKDIQKIVEENPYSLDMEMVAEHSASGATEEIGSVFVEEISSWDNSECPVEDLLPSDYPFDCVIRVTTGN